MQKKCSAVLCSRCSLVEWHGVYLHASGPDDDVLRRLSTAASAATASAAVPSTASAAVPADAAAATACAASAPSWVVLFECLGEACA